MLKIVHSAINTKALSRWSDLACSIALDAVRTVELEDNGRKEIDIKKYAKVEKVRDSAAVFTWPPRRSFNQAQISNFLYKQVVHMNHVNKTT